MTQQRADIRNIAIIAHVDHGKTTLVDGMLKQAKVFRDAELPPGSVSSTATRWNANAASPSWRRIPPITWNDIKINIVDTPGHADFGGEVERVLNMVDGALLLVDAVEGPMPQTRFVLRKALALGLRIIVVINKVDRSLRPRGRGAERDVRPVHRTGRDRRAGRFPGDLRRRAGRPRGLHRRGHPAESDPAVRDDPQGNSRPHRDPDAPVQLQVTSLEYDNYKGQIGVGRLLSGTHAARDGDRADNAARRRAQHRQNRLPVHLS